MSYKDIVSKIEDKSIINLMKELGASDYRETDSYILFPTICHNQSAHEASMKLYFYKDTKIFYCYTECGGMSIFKFLEHVYKTRGIEYEWYTDVYLPIVECAPRKNIDGFTFDRVELLKDKYERKERNIKLSEYPEGVLNIFIKEYPIQWLRDGITKAAMDKFNILFSISQNKIILPHYDVNDNLIGIRGRALNKWEVENLGKYMPIQIEQKWYNHRLSLNLYGLNKNKENIRKRKIVYIFEGEKSVLQCENFSQPNCAVAVCGSSLNKFQIDILMRTCQPIEFIVCFDKEEDFDDRYFNKLWNLCKKYSNYGNFSFIYDMENLLQMKDSPSDRGEETFNKLINRRIVVK